MTRRELRDRYAGQILAVFWAVGHPVLLMGVYVFVFGYIFPTRLHLTEEVPRSLVTYFLAGLIPWLTFSESMAKGAGVIIQHAGLVKQVVYRLEILRLGFIDIRRTMLEETMHSMAGRKPPA